MAGHAQYNLTSSDGTTAKALLGQEINVKGAQYKYLLAGEALNQYDLIVYDKTLTAYQSDTDDSGFSTAPKGFAIPQFAVASGEYFWAPVGPFYLREDGSTAFKVTTAAAAAIDVVLYATATAGAVDDTGTVKVQGLALRTAAGGAAATNCIAYQRMFTSL